MHPPTGKAGSDTPIVVEARSPNSHLPDEVIEAMTTPMPVMHLIIPASSSSHTGALYLGSLSAFFDPELLSSHSISALVQVVDSAWLVGAEGIENIQSYRLDILDSIGVDLKPYLEATVQWIDERLKKGVNVLVHCQEGISRSSSIVIAYLIYTHNMTYDNALALVKGQRACVKPNRGFAKCLRDWERQLSLTSGDDLKSLSKSVVLNTASVTESSLSG